MIQTRRDDASTTADEAMSPVRCLELVTRADAPEAPHAPVDAPVDALLDRVGLTEEEVSRLPPDLRKFHACLINAPEGMAAVTIDIPPEMFLHEGRDVVMPFKEFNDFLQADSSEDKWLDEGVITVWLMLVTKNYLYHVYSTQIYILM